MLEMLGGRTRARTWDPMIKGHSQAVMVQSVFRHVLVSSSTKIIGEFSVVGIERRCERVVGSNRTVGGSSRESATAFPHTTQICDIFSDRPPKVSETCRMVGSNRGHATTDTDIRFKSRFETSGEFHRDIPPPTPRSEATVCAVTGGNIAELAATAFVALLIVLLSVRTIGYRGELSGPRHR